MSITVKDLDLKEIVLQRFKYKEFPEIVFVGFSTQITECALNLRLILNENFIPLNCWV